MGSVRFVRFALAVLAFAASMAAPAAAEPGPLIEGMCIEVGVAPGPSVTVCTPEI